MRIIAGEWRGRALNAPKGETTRPTSGRVREALFNIIGPLHGARVLDLFSGTGAVAFEAISRGATHAQCVERARSALDSFRANAQRLEAGSRVELVATDVARFLERPSKAPFDLVFADPPWREASRFLEVHGPRLEALVSPSGWLVLEQPRRSQLTPNLPGLTEPDIRIYGDTALVIYRSKRTH